MKLMSGVNFKFIVSKEFKTFIWPDVGKSAQQITYLQFKI